MRTVLCWLLLCGTALAQPNTVGVVYGTTTGTVADGGIVAANTAAITTNTSSIATLTGSVAGYVTQRAPRATDDTTAGYAIGSLWRDQQSRWWKADRVTTANATWLPAPIGGLPLDALPTAGVAYGAVKLRSAYAGNAMTLTRASDSTTVAIGFLNSGIMDAATGDAFCASTTCYITAWNDQSGNALDATQATVANAPLWLPGNLVGTLRAVSFASILHGITNQPATQLYLNMPAGFSWTPSSSVWLFAGQHVNAHEQARVLVETNAHVGWMSSYSTNAPSFAIEGLGVFCGTGSESGPSIIVLSWQTTSGLKTCQSNNGVLGTHTGPSTSATTGGHISSDTAGQSMTSDLVAVIGYTRALTAAQIDTGRRALMAVAGIAPQTEDVVIQGGDSTMSGAGSTQNGSITSYALQLVNRPVRFVNLAVFGKTLSALSAGFNTAEVDLYSSTLRRWVYLAEGGANDIRGGATAATVYGYLQTVVSRAKAQGSNVRVVVLTMPLQCDIFNNATYKASLQSLNALIVSNWNVPQGSGGLGADALADLQADPTVGPGNYTSSTFCSTTYSPDGQHPLDITMQYLAVPISTAIATVLK